MSGSQNLENILGIDVLEDEIFTEFLQIGDVVFLGSKQQIKSHVFDSSINFATVDEFHQLAESLVVHLIKNNSVALRFKRVADESFLEYFWTI